MLLRTIVKFRRIGDGNDAQRMEKEHVAGLPNRPVPLVKKN